MKGTVKWFNEIKRFGFIAGEDGEDYFVHYSDIENRESLKEGVSVTFEPVNEARGLKAVKVAVES